MEGRATPVPLFSRSNRGDGASLLKPRWHCEGVVGIFQHVPRKIRQLIADLEQAGFYMVPGAGKGSHRKFRHPKYAGSLILSGKEGDDARHYQEKEVRHAIRETSK